ncbi:MAG: DUF4870 domain-containing protein [Candidatus Promineifilaceae bacterium]|jgi:uncharacterized Tic20 family protein
MDKEMYVSQEERTMAALAHGSILLGIFTSGIGGIFAALIIWLNQREKSVYAARQALQALVYQTSVLLLSFIGFCLWGILFIMMFLPPMIANPELYQYTPPATMWVGMCLLVCPFGIWAATVLYGVWAAVRCLSGADFQYPVIGTLVGNGD